MSNMGSVRVTQMSAPDTPNVEHYTTEDAYKKGFYIPEKSQEGKTTIRGVPVSVTDSPAIELIPDGTAGGSSGARVTGMNRTYHDVPLADLAVHLDQGYRDMVGHLAGGRIEKAQEISDGLSAWIDAGRNREKLQLIAGSESSDPIVQKLKPIAARLVQEGWRNDPNIVKLFDPNRNPANVAASERAKLSQASQLGPRTPGSPFSNAVEDAQKSGGDLNDVFGPFADAAAPGGRHRGGGGGSGGAGSPGPVSFPYDDSNAPPLTTERVYGEALNLQQQLGLSEGSSVALHELAVPAAAIARLGTQHGNTILKMVKDTEGYDTANDYEKVAKVASAVQRVTKVVAEYAGQEGSPETGQPVFNREKAKNMVEAFPKMFTEHGITDVNRAVDLMHRVSASAVPALAEAYGVQMTSDGLATLAAATSKRFGGMVTTKGSPQNSDADGAASDIAFLSEYIDSLQRLHVPLARAAGAPSGDDDPFGMVVAAAGRTLMLTQALLANGETGSLEELMQKAKGPLSQAMVGLNSADADDLAGILVPLIAGKIVSSDADRTDVARLLLRVAGGSTEAPVEPEAPVASVGAVTPEAPVASVGAVTPEAPVASVGAVTPEASTAPGAPIDTPPPEPAGDEPLTPTPESAPPGQRLFRRVQETIAEADQDTVKEIRKDFIDKTTGGTALAGVNRSNRGFPGKKGEAAFDPGAVVKGFVADYMSRRNDLKEGSQEYKDAEALATAVADESLSFFSGSIATAAATAASAGRGSFWRKGDPHVNTFLDNFSFLGERTAPVRGLIDTAQGTVFQKIVDMPVELVVPQFRGVDMPVEFVVPQFRGGKKKMPEGRTDGAGGGNGATPEWRGTSYLVLPLLLDDNREKFSDLREAVADTLRADPSFEPSIRHAFSALDGSMQQRAVEGFIDSTTQSIILAVSASASASAGLGLKYPGDMDAKKAAGSSLRDALGTDKVSDVTRLFDSNARKLMNAPLSWVAAAIVRSATIGGLADGSEARERAVGELRHLVAGLERQIIPSDSARIERDYSSRGIVGVRGAYHGTSPRPHGLRVRRQPEDRLDSGSFIHVGGDLRGWDTPDMAALRALSDTSRLFKRGGNAKGFIANLQNFGRSLLTAATGTPAEPPAPSPPRGPASPLVQAIAEQQYGAGTPIRALTPEQTKEVEDRARRVMTSAQTVVGNSHKFGDTKDLETILNLKGPLVRQAWELGFGEVFTSMIPEVRNRVQNGKYETARDAMNDVLGIFEGYRVKAETKRSNDQFTLQEELTKMRQRAKGMKSNSPFAIDTSATFSDPDDSE